MTFNGAVTGRGVTYGRDVAAKGVTSEEGETPKKAAMMSDLQQ